MTKQKLSKTDALKLIADYILDGSKEHDDYVDMCTEHDIDPKDLQGKRQRTHVYALALIGLEMKF